MQDGRSRENLNSIKSQPHQGKQWSHSNGRIEWNTPAVSLRKGPRIFVTLGVKGWNFVTNIDQSNPKHYCSFVRVHWSLEIYSVYISWLHYFSDEHTQAPQWRTDVGLLRCNRSTERYSAQGNATVRAAGDYNGISSRLAYELQPPSTRRLGYPGRIEGRQYGWRRSHAGKTYIYLGYAQSSENVICR